MFINKEFTKDKTNSLQVFNKRCVCIPMEKKITKSSYWSLIFNTYSFYSYILLSRKFSLYKMKGQKKNNLSFYLRYNLNLIFLCCSLNKALYIQFGSFYYHFSGFLYILIGIYFSLMYIISLYNLCSRNKNWFKMRFNRTVNLFSL